ncbi:hypothetical protein NDU88_005287 [Pleurodeles waltl]|uniref:Uncharacterized protein n=1 Tax=Pleurodeles waltl TaxID=8319 RepID=A0AAV7LKQ4_PLEWA|nr:hypothetical protein NDU88_005287 [Pleurodeles waltl]
MTVPGRFPGARLLLERSLPQQQSEAAEAARDRALRRERCPYELRPWDEAMFSTRAGCFLLEGSRSCGCTRNDRCCRFSRAAWGLPEPANVRWELSFPPRLSPSLAEAALGGTPTLADMVDGRGGAPEGKRRIGIYTKK